MVIMHSTHSSTVTTGSIAGCVTTTNTNTNTTTNTTTTTNSSLSLPKSKSQSSQPLNNSISISNNNIKLLSSTMIMMNSSSSSSSSKKRQRQRQCVSVISTTQKDNIINILKTIHPTDYIKAAFKANGYNRCNNNDNNDNNKDFDDFDYDFDFDDVTKRCISRFKHTKPTKDMLYAYNSTDIALAVRTNNVILARQLYNNGNGNGVYNGTNACNRFGESILHIACRRGNIDMIKFLINEVGLRLDTDTIRDDYNRTPLHDAFWTTTSADINNSSSYDVIDFLLTSQPNVVELLLLKDIRGYTPLDYARSEHRTKWLHFLWKRRNILRVSSSSSTPTTTTTDDIIIDSIDSIKEQQSQQQQSQSQQSQSQPQNKRQRLSQ